jgi:hypothetical protein
MNQAASYAAKQKFNPRNFDLVKVANTGQSVEVAPGETLADLPEKAAPKVGIVKWIPQGDGTYRPKIQVLENWIRTTHAPLYGVHIKPETLVRLGNSGFIELTQTSPGHNAVNLESVLAHVERCKDPEFWTSARIEQYRTAFWNFRVGDK